MKVVTGLILLLVSVRLSRSCYGSLQSLFCTSIPSTFSSGYSSILIVVKDVGEINSTVFRSDSLSSVTSLSINSAGITGITEGAFTSFQNLTSLSLKQNLLTNFNPNWFGRPDILSELNLSENQIQVVNESMLNGLAKLTRLNLSKNRIRTVDPDSFSSNTMLAELDLSENRITRLPPQVFRSLRSTRIGLNGNPWDCSCGAEDFVDFLKELQNRSLLDKPMQVTCDSPASLRGRPAWNVSVCVTSTPPSVTQPGPPKPTTNLTAVPASTPAATTSPSGSTSGTKTSVQPKPTDAPTILSSHTATVITTPPTSLASGTKTSVQPRHTDPSITHTATVITTPLTRPTSGTKTSVQPKPTDPPITHTATAVTSPPTRPTSGTKTSVQPRPTDPPITHSATVVTTPPSGTKTSVQPKPTDPPVIMSSHTATFSSRPPSEKKTSVHPKPTQLLTTITSTLKTGTFAASVTSPPSVTEISVHPKPSDPPTAVTTPSEPRVTSRPPSDTNTVCTLVVVIVVLSMLLFMVFFLAVLHRRKRSSKSVTPGCPEGFVQGKDSKEDDGCEKHSEERENSIWDSEMGWRKSFTGVRAKSANAILFTSPFCAPVKHQEGLQTQSKDAENQAEGEQKLRDESEEEGGIQTENLTMNADAIKHAKQSDASRNLDEKPTNTDIVPYLSIGMNQNKPSPDGFSKGQRSQTGKVMGRISTWPPTAVQWQERCKMKEGEEEKEGSDVLTVWTTKSPDEVKKEHPCLSKDDKIETNHLENSLKMTESHMNSGHSQSSKPNDKTTSSEALSHTDTGLEEQLKTQNLNQEKLQHLKSAENPAHKKTKKSSRKAEQRDEPKRAETSRRRAETRSSGSQAPSGGTSPDDETLLSGNEYAFMGLLHEVVQNNGRWTRERWKQTHVNKQRSHDRGTEGV